MLGGDCLGEQIWRSALMFPCRLVSHCWIGSELPSDVSSSAAGIGGLQTSETTAAGQTCASGTCIAEAGEYCSAVSHPHPELLDMHAGILVPVHVLCRQCKCLHIAPLRKTARAVQRFAQENSETRNFIAQESIA
jgi:hypothetical protein